MPTTSRMVIERDDEHRRHVEHRAGARPALGEQPPHVQPASGGAVWTYGADVYCAGMWMPKSLRKETTYPDQPIATVVAREEVLEDQVPADDPGDELAQGGVAVGVGRCPRSGSSRRTRRSTGRRRRRRCPRARRRRRWPGRRSSRAAWPVSTKMPAPMMAPMPSAMRFSGPSARLRLWSAASTCGLVSRGTDRPSRGWRMAR